MRHAPFFWILLLICGIALAAGFSFSARGGSPIMVGKADSQNRSIDTIDHQVWDDLLAKYVNPKGLVDYAGWKSNHNDVQRLEGYLNELSSASRTEEANPRARLAFWINAYNALTIHGILREYPTDTIRNHTARFFGYNIWDDLQLFVGGKPYSLHRIENKVLRKLNEPRIHFAIVCASMGCPRLLDRAYTADDVEAQLATNTRHFFAQPQNFRFDRSAQRFYLSMIFKWFDQDFGGNRSGMLATIADWLPSESARVAAEKKNVSVSYLRYDWSLNDQQ